MGFHNDGYDYRKLMVLCVCVCTLRRMSGRGANATLTARGRDWIRWRYVETTPEQKGSLTRTPGVHTTHSGAEFVARERERPNDVQYAGLVRGSRQQLLC